MDKRSINAYITYYEGFGADDDVIDDPKKFIIYEQAENGLWTKVAVLALTIYGVK